MKRSLILFLGAVMLGTLLTAGSFWATAEPSFPGTWLTEDIFIREQMAPADVVRAGQKNFTTIVDLRPDGEAAGQPSSASMADAASRESVAFHYVPVPHGPIPGKAVADLDRILRQVKGPVLMYCRSGARAARTWALMEASRSEGRNTEEIVARVKASGFPVDDLKAEIAAGVAARAKPKQ